MVHSQNSVVLSVTGRTRRPCRLYRLRLYRRGLYGWSRAYLYRSVLYYERDNGVGCAHRPGVIEPVDVSAALQQAGDGLLRQVHQAAVFF
jgi:hypothetical protein